MAATTVTTIPSSNKRKRDSTNGSGSTAGLVVEVEPDLRPQVCRQCTLAWPWVVFQRNNDETRKLDEDVCFSCLGILEQHWENDQISRAKRKLLHVNTNPNPNSNMTTGQSGTPLRNTPTTSTPSRPPPPPLIPSRQSQPQAQTYVSLPTPSPTPAYNQTQSQAQAQAQAILAQRARAQAQATQAQIQIQAVNRSGQSLPYTNASGIHNPAGGGPVYQYQAQPPHFYGTSQVGQQQLNPNSGYTYQYQPINPWDRLYGLPEPSRAMHWVFMNYEPSPGAIPIPQTELYQHYQQSIPRTGFPPLMGGKEFIITTAQHFAPQGVTLNKMNFTINGLWRRAHPLALA